MIFDPEHKETEREAGELEEGSPAHTALTGPIHPA